MDFVLSNLALRGCEGHWDIGIASGHIAAIERRLTCDAPREDMGGKLGLPGFVDSHIHLDKACLLGQCAHATDLKQAIAAVSRLKADFTEADVYRRGAIAVERAIAQGTTHMRTHVELDPAVGLRGFAGVMQLRRDYAWALDMQVCVFPQEGLLNVPGTDALLEQALRQGADLIGGCPYADTAPLDHLRQIFDLARQFGCDIDLHLDFDLDPAGMLLGAVCDLTDEYGMGGRVAAGHVTSLSMAAPPQWREMTARLRDAGVAITALPATDLYLLGRDYTHAVPRGVTPVHRLAAEGVGAAVATNNVANPFTPFGDCSLLRMANLYANVCHAAPAEFEQIVDLVTDAPARLMRLGSYGLTVGNPADLVILDAETAADALSAIAQPLTGYKRGRKTFARPAPVLFPAESGSGASAA